MRIREAAYLCLTLLAAPVHALDFGRMPAGSVSVYVSELGSGKVVAEHRADVPVNPASTMKLVTAFAAFGILGGDYRWRTDFKSAAPVRNHVLEGDVYWVGSGNPVFDQHDLQDAQRQMRAQGISDIGGGVVLDRRLWGEVRNPPDFASDAGEAFMTPPDPNMLAYKVVRLQPRIDAEGSVSLLSDPPLPESSLNVRLTADNESADGECAALQKYMRAVYKGGVLDVSGRLPSACSDKEMFVNMWTMREFVQKSFTGYWRLAGGRVSDGLKSGETPDNARILATVYSKPLSSILTDMNKYSNNVIARSVFLKLGGERPAAEAAQAADAAVRQVLDKAGVDTAPLVLENGSGLSRTERVSARMMGQLLERAYAAPFGRAFIDTLPIAGTDGTLKKRLRQPGEKLRLKTGTLKDVRALAGYWLGDKPMVVVVIVNSPDAALYLRDLDRMVAKLVQPGGNAWIDGKMSCLERLPV